MSMATDESHNLTGKILGLFKRVQDYFRPN